MTDATFLKLLLLVLAAILCASGYTGGWALAEALGTVVTMVLIASVVTQK